MIDSYKFNKPPWQASPLKEKRAMQKLTGQGIGASKLPREKNTELQNAKKLLCMERSHRKRLETELRKKNEYIDTLHDSVLGMFQYHDMSQTLEAIIIRASRLTGIPDGFIYIYDYGTRGLELKAVCGGYKKLKDTGFPPGHDIAKMVWESRKTMQTDDWQALAENNDSDEFKFVRAMVVVPLGSEENIAGILGLSQHTAGIKIEHNSVEILEQFAGLASLAIDNARRFKSLTDEFHKRDHTEKENRQMENRLHHSQKMEAIGTLAGGIAHDFNNILFPVIGFSQMMINDLPENSIMKNQVQSVLDGALRAKNLVQQILTFSRETEHEYRPLKLQLIVKEALKLARASLPSTIRITSNIPKDLSMVMADPTQIHQITMNLLTNAFHAMEENGGELSVAISEVLVTESDPPVPKMFPGDYLCLTIKDTGCGMDKQTISRIYEPYFTTKKSGKGSGLGLFVVHGIVKNLHGDICVHSSPGKGSSFSVYLPKFVDKQENNNHATRSASSLKGYESILLIDDEKAILSMVTQMFTRLGYQVTAFDKSVDALSCFESSPHEFDLVITDLTMPDITGDKVVSHIKSIRQEIPVILCTGFSEKMVNIKITGPKPDKVLMKPSGKDELLCSVRTLLDQSLQMNQHC
ncbi:ATP-binding protein [uncultured Desulfobacter sp.]|uniref:hybrid sensor histidine kinase/response regulator n=1 Tax=uncultured Desulfobacter sp. TaxID=240139 RepID=UPI002AAB86C4|nr:ATP-binding protein [uncultured Desulfobacter sp.]